MKMICIVLILFARWLLNEVILGQESEINLRGSVVVERSLSQTSPQQSQQWSPQDSFGWTIKDETQNFRIQMSYFEHGMVSSIQS